MRRRRRWGIRIVFVYRSLEGDLIDSGQRTQASHVYYATASGAAGGVVEGGKGGAVASASGRSGVGVSSTPWPLQSGHELRPVVSHWEGGRVSVCFACCEVRVFGL